MKKNVLAFLMASALLGLTACGDHTHSAGDGWVSDPENHWKVCECGEKVESGAHTLEDEVCTVCGTEIVTFEDGAKLLMAYNEYGDCTQYVSYMADGGVDYEERVEYTYDADGNKRSEKGFSGEELSYEREYASDASGEVYISKDVTYWEDGTREIGEYDENGNTLCYTSYHADGSVNYRYEYEYSPEAGWMREKTYEGDRLIGEQEFLTDEDGNQNTIRYVYYYEDGTSSLTEYDAYGNETLEAVYGADGTLESSQRYENEYDADGNQTLRRTYEGDRLAEEMEFLFGSDEDGSWSMSGKTTVYHEDGTKTVSDSDLEATWATEITYAADGSVIEELRYEYLKDENGEDIGSKGYKNGRLFVETQAITSPDGTPGMLWIDYDEDGTKTVAEYNDSFDLVKETVYDAAGNVISES